MFNFFKKNFFYNLVIIITIFILDRVSKLYVINFYKKNNGIDLFNSDFLNIILIWNEGIAFGLFSFNNDLFYNIITIIIILIIIIVLVMISKTNGSEKIGFLFIAGGALGNLYDRLAFKAVPDFIDLHIHNFHWFIFNIADIFVTLGVLCLILVEIFFKKKHSEVN
tara:strand:- start:177 stop:674 length:498 start_codon:yes stop_codon:yes gene_type:complete